MAIQKSRNPSELTLGFRSGYVVTYHGINEATVPSRNITKDIMDTAPYGITTTEYQPKLINHGIFGC